MEWLGLGAWELSAVLGASVVATLALYLLRPRRRTVVVPHLELFDLTKREVHGYLPTPFWVLAALTLYAEVGFQRIKPYYASPIPGAVFLSRPLP